MLKIHVNGNSVEKIESMGSVLDTCKELSLAVNAIYFALQNNDSGVAAFFRYAMTETFTRADSPLFEPQRCAGTSMVVAVPKDWEGKQHG